MDRHLNLVENTQSELEKRVFPRFPFCYLIFKSESSDKSFQVVDISLTGMQLSLKEGGHQYKAEEPIKGEVHWRGKTLLLTGKVRWIRGQRLGVSFKKSTSFDQAIRDFLSIEHVVQSMRCLHQNSLGLEIPSNLKYWLQADGPVEIFVWRHNDGEISRFHLILFDRFVEWEDGQGLKSGTVVNKRDMDTPLVSEDEFLFSIDHALDNEKLEFAHSVIAALTTNHLPAEALDFLKLKLGH